MTSRFVRPETCTLTLSNGDTLTVKRRLNHGEQKASFARMYLAGADGHVRVNPFQAGDETIVAYLLDWSLKDPSGQVVVIAGQPLNVVRAALDAQAPESVAELRSAIDAHIEAVEREVGDERLIPFGASASSAT